MISEIMRRRRIELRKKPSEIALIVGVSESTYRDWENGRKIQGEPYKLIAKALDLSVSELLELESPSQEYIKKELSEIENHVKNIRKFVS
jgi:transcriptional regulator with XRE-family HTH domain